MEVKRISCCTVSVSLKTPSELEQQRGGRILNHTNFDPINVSYYKLHIIGKIASLIGLAFKVTVEGSTNVYYLSKADAINKLAERFGIISQPMRERVFAAAFNLIPSGYYDFRANFRMQLRDILREQEQIEREQEQIKSEQERLRREQLQKEQEEKLRIGQAPLIAGGFNPTTGQIGEHVEPNRSNVAFFG